MDEHGFTIYFDAIDVVLGFVLVQHGRVTTYVSRQLKLHAKNYHIHNLKLASFFFEFEIWRHYLYGFHVRFSPTIIFFVHIQLERC